VNAFIDEHRAAHGVEPICSALQVAPVTLPASVTLHSCQRAHGVTRA
jgi:hypothetical protein